MARKRESASVDTDQAPTYPRTVELTIDQPGKTTEVADEATFIDLERQGLIRSADVDPAGEPDEDGESIGGSGSVEGGDGA